MPREDRTTATSTRAVPMSEEASAARARMDTREMGQPMELDAQTTMSASWEPTTATRTPSAPIPKAASRAPASQDIPVMVTSVELDAQTWTSAPREGRTIARPLRFVSIPLAASIAESISARRRPYAAALAETVIRAASFATAPLMRIPASPALSVKPASTKTTLAFRSRPDFAPMTSLSARPRPIVEELASSVKTMARRALPMRIAPILCDALLVQMLVSNVLLWVQILVNVPR